MPNGLLVFVVNGKQLLSLPRAPCGNGVVGKLWSSATFSGFRCKVMTFGVTEMSKLGLELRTPLKYAWSLRVEGPALFTLFNILCGCCSQPEKG